MYWTSLLPVTIFILAHTLGVSQSAATGRQRLTSSEGEAEAVGGESRPLQRQQEEQSDDDNDLPLRTAGFPSSAASSIESPVPDWINLRPDKDNALDENDEEEWGVMPLSSVGKLRYGQLGGGGGSDAGGPKESVLLQQSSSPYNTNSNKNNRLMLLTPEDLASLHRYYYKDGGVVVGGGLIKRGDKLKRMYLATKLREQAGFPSASSRASQSNYRLPAESNTVRGNFDKRSPRCIANCMRQGLVHPIQCHSLCR